MLEQVFRNPANFQIIKPRIYAMLAAEPCKLDTVCFCDNFPLKLFSQDVSLTAHAAIAIHKASAISKVKLKHLHKLLNRLENRKCKCIQN